MFLLGAATGSVLIVDLLIILGSAGIVALAMQRLKLSLIPAYLITGLVIGPGGLGLVGSEGHVAEIGDLAIVLLMFGIGMHLDWATLRGRVRVLITSGVLAVVVTTLALWPICMVVDARPPVALALAMALSLSSTAVVMRLLQRRLEVKHRKGQISLAVLVVQDLAVVAMLLLLPPLAQWNGTFVGTQQADAEGWGHFFLDGLKVIGGLGGLVIFGRFLLPALLREAARMRSDEVMIVIATAFAIGAAALSAWLHLSPELGAFLGGFLLSNTQFKHQLGGQIGTVRDLFIAVFFTTFGMNLSFGVIADEFVVITIGVAVLLFVKSLTIGVSAWAVGASAKMSIIVGLCLAQAGEFSLIVLKNASSETLSLVDEQTLGVVSSVVAITLALTPLLFRLGDLSGEHLQLHLPAPWHKGGSLRDDAIDDTSNTPHVIVAGFGIVGRAVTDRLTAAGRRVNIVELNPQTVRTQHALGWHVVYGDVSNAEVLKSVGIERADVLVLTMPDADSVARACRVARSLNPDIFILARTAFVGQGFAVRQLGANTAIVEEMAVAEAMEREIVGVLQQLEAKRESRGSSEGETGDSDESAPA